MKTFSVVSVNVSTDKGVPKRPAAFIECAPDLGISGDAHAGPGIRQISLLAVEDIETMAASGTNVVPGDFAENITTRGIDLAALPVGTHIRIGKVTLEITQIGKECRRGCAIMRTVGDCIMPRRGVFARVISSGRIDCETAGSYDI